MPAKSDKQWFKIMTPGRDETVVMIYDDIGMWGISAKDFVEKLNAIQTAKISLRINSNGGEAFEAFAIYNAIKNHAADVTVHVDGIAASAASVVALAGDRVCIAKNAYIMIHNVMTMCYGNADYLRKQADIIDKMSTGIAETYAQKTGKTIDEIKKALDDESWFNATEAKAFGLVDDIEDGDGEEDEDDMPEALARALVKYNKAPENLRKIAARFIEGAAVPSPAQIQPITPEAHMPEKLFIRDGKHFVKVGDKEVEVEMTGGSAPAVAAVTPPTITPEEAVKKEREYRRDFMAAMDTAGIAGDNAKSFEEKFYGRSMDDVKFLASNTIASRAKPVGEGSGEPEGAAGETSEQKKEREIVAAAEKRFGEEVELRRMFNLRGTETSDSPVYKAALSRFVTQSKKYAQYSVKP